MAWCCLQWMLSIDYKKYSHILWSHATPPFIPDMMRLHRCWPFDKKPCLCLEVPVELNWTCGQEVWIFSDHWHVPKEGRKQLIVLRTTGLMHSTHLLCWAPACHTVSRLCIVGFSNWKLHRVGWGSWLGYALLTTDTAGSMHSTHLLCCVPLELWLSHSIKVMHWTV